MRVAHFILAAVTIAGSTVPATASPFWQKQTAVAPQHQAAPAAVPGAKSMMAQPQGASPNLSPNPSVVPKPRLMGPGPHNGDWLRKYGSLPPAEQEQKLQNDPVFRGLTPQKQESLINRLRVFNSLPPAKKQQMLNRMETYEHLTPSQQKQADGLYQQYRGLPAEQQSQVSQAYRKLREMSPEQRTQYFNSDEFRNGLNDEQRGLLRGMSELYPSQAR